MPILLLKYPGETMNQFMIRIKKQFNLHKISYTARLDPFARGIVTILIDNECKFINSYLNSVKTYQVKIIFGIKTDSDDPLGLICESKSVDHHFIHSNLILLISSYLKSNVNIPFSQKYHYFSRKLLNHRRQNITSSSDSHIVQFIDYNILNFKYINFNKWKNKIISYINSIDSSCNFRQSTISTQWQNLSLSSLPSLKLSIVVSSGFFIRQFINDLSGFINFPLMCYDINRTNIY